MKIRIYKLQGCKFCEMTLGVIEQLGLPCAIVDANLEENRSECDKLENFFESNRYPKLILEKKGKTIFINPYEGKRLSSFGDNIFEYFEAIEDISSIIKKHQNEI